MASDNIWQMFQDLGSQISRPKLQRSHSFTLKPRITERASSKGPRSSQATPQPKRRLRRANTVTYSQKDLRKMSHISNVSDTAAALSGAESIDENKLKAPGWKLKKLKVAKDKGWELLKKAGDKAGKMLAAEHSKDSADEDDAESKKSKISGSVRSESEDTDTYYDAASRIILSPETLSQMSTVVPPFHTHEVLVADNVGSDDVTEVKMRRRVVVYNPACPIHGINRFPLSDLHRQSRQLTIGESSDTVEFSGSESDFPILASQAYAAKMARKRKRAILTGPERERVAKEKLKIISNLSIISLAFFILSTAFQGLQNLQTSVNSADGLGAISLAVVYFGLGASSLFFPPYLLNRLGCKLTLIVSMSLYALYMLANFMPKWYSLIPASFLLGVAAASLWAAKCAYLTETGVRYAILNVESPNIVIVRFFGIFFMIVHLGQVSGNIISSVLLRVATESVSFGPDAVDMTCGHFFVEKGTLSATAVQNLARPPQRAFQAVCGAYFCCSIVATLILAAFLNPLKRDKAANLESPRFTLEVWKATIENLRKPKDLLLIPLTIFNGMEQAFIAGEFTKAYVGCCLGISHIGYVMTSFGVADALCSLVFGPLIKMFGRMPLFMFGAVVDMLMIFTLLTWPPNPHDIAIFYVIAAAWGMADGVWNTQINGLWVVLFSQNLEVAFANYRLWESVGFMLAFALTPFLTTEYKLYILLTALLLGMLGYGLIEVWEPLETYLLRVRYAAGELYNYYTETEKKDPTGSLKKNDSMLSATPSAATPSTAVPIDVPL